MPRTGATDVINDVNCTIHDVSFKARVRPRTAGLFNSAPGATTNYYVNDATHLSTMSCADCRAHATCDAAASTPMRSTKQSPCSRRPREITRRSDDDKVASAGCRACAVSQQRRTHCITRLESMSTRDDAPRARPRWGIQSTGQGTRAMFCYMTRQQPARDTIVKVNKPSGV